MEQETITTKTVELIVVRRDSKNGEAVPTVMGMNERIRYHFPMADVLRIVKRTTIEEVLFSRTPTTIYLPSGEATAARMRTEAQLAKIEEDRLYRKRLKAEADCLSQRRPRKPRKKETEPRAVCRATCCGAQHRRKSSLDGFCFDCRPSNSASREEVKY